MRIIEIELKEIDSSREILEKSEKISIINLQEKSRLYL